MEQGGSRGIGRLGLENNKAMKSTHKNALEIADRGGAVAASDWACGRYKRYISKRPIPELCREIYSDEIETLKGKSKLAAKQLLRDRPRIQKIIIVDDWRKLNRIRKEQQD